jgi:UDP-N-acetylmuramoyl-tripeptide--D-alanyl-D-alanine ligase
VLPEHEYSILRCAVDQPGELEQVLDTLLPKIGILTNVQHAHLAAFGSIEELARDHLSLVKMTDPQGVTILNTDDDYVRGAQRFAKSRVVTISIDNFGADFMAYNVIVGVQGTGFDLLYEGRRYLGCWAPLLGRHNLYSLLAGLAVGVESGVAVETSGQDAPDAGTQQCAGD